MIKSFYDNTLYIYCLFLTLMAGIFLGSEIETMKTDATVRQANRIVKNCQTIISKGIYE